MRSWDIQWDFVGTCTKQWCRQGDFWQMRNFEALQITTTWGITESARSMAMSTFESPQLILRPSEVVGHGVMEHIHYAHSVSNMVLFVLGLLDECLKVQFSFVTFPAETDNIMLPKNSCPEDMEAARHDPSVVSILEQVGMILPRRLARRMCGFPLW